MKDYTSKVYDGFEIRFFEDHMTNKITGVLFKNNKPVGIIEKGKGGTVVHMETGSKTSIIKRLRNAITRFNSGEAELVHLNNSKENKFKSGDILIETDTNVVEIEDVMVVFYSGTAYDKLYQVMLFKPTDDGNVDITIDNVDKDSIDNTHISIGIDDKIIDLYNDINNKYEEIDKLKKSIYLHIQNHMKMLNKTNDDFYNDLLNYVNKSSVSEYEKEKYKEFIKAAYLNNEES